MEPRDYIVKKIEGDYAILAEIGTEEEFFIAMALLPEGTDIGVKLHYEMMSYEIVE
ncbi:MAG: hypothetical protein IJ302_10005 [Clostridia bacterium]|nr:hypothetical protein [Clostridia bacterium]